MKTTTKCFTLPVLGLLGATLAFNGVNACATTINVPTDQPTIQAAINAASAGDTIAVDSGVYAESLNVDKQLTIQGAGSASTVIDATGKSFGMLVTAGGVSASQRLTIKGLTIKNATYDGIRAYKAGGLNLNHVTIDDVVLTLNKLRGLEINNGVTASDIEVKNSSLVGNVGQGLRSASDAAINGMTLTDSSFDGNSYGIYLQTKTTINGLRIVRCTFNNSVNYGGYMTEAGSLTGVSIEDSEFNSNVIGLEVWNEGDNAGITITRTKFENNRKWGVTIGGGSLTDVLIQDSSVKNNDGLNEDDAGIEFYTYDGIMHNVAVHQTDIFGQGAGLGLQNWDTVDTVDATCNWWGDASGPSGAGSGSGDAVIGNVTYAPWLLAPAPSPCIGGTPLGDKMVVLATLQGLLPGANKQTADKLNQAIDDLTKSIAPGLWTDSSHLAAKDGQRVFDQEKDCVNKLEQIKNPPTAVVQAVLELVVADQTLAQTAIDDAIAAGGDPKKIAQAQNEMDKATAELAKGHADAAIDHYKNAWQKAQQAM